MSEDAPDYGDWPVHHAWHIMRDGFAKINHAVVRTTELGRWAKMALISLISHADIDGNCWPLLKTIASYWDASEMSMKTGLKELRDKGIISQRHRGQGVSDIYTIEWDAIEELTSRHRVRQTNIVPLGIQTNIVPLDRQDLSTEEEPFKKNHNIYISTGKKNKKRAPEPPINEAYLAELQDLYSGFDVAWEWARCRDNYAGRGKAIKSERPTLRNWMRNELKWRKEREAKLATAPEPAEPKRRNLAAWLDGDE